MRHKLLVVAPSWVGDMVMAHAPLRYLKERQPDLHITLFVTPLNATLCERMPEVDAVIHDPFRHGELRLRERYRLGRRLRGQFDQSIVLRLPMKSALLPFFARVPHRRGFLGEMRFGVINDRVSQNNMQMPSRFLRFLHLAGMPYADFEQAPCFYPNLLVNGPSQKACIKDYGIDLARPRLMLCPGAAQAQSKKWPLPHVIALVRLYQARGWQVLIVGGAGEQAMAETIVQAVGKSCLDLTSTTLPQAADILALATVVVSNDSGLMHLAASVGAPVVAIYGATAPAFAPPLTDKGIILQDASDPPLACRPCEKKTCRFQHYACLNRITPPQVDMAIKQLLHRIGQPSEAI